jgi:hypothetical protein
MNFLTKMNFTYVIIIVIIIMASIHLYKLKSTENFEDIPIYKNQLIGNSVQILIPAMSQVKFGGSGLDTILGTMINEKATKTELTNAISDKVTISELNNKVNDVMPAYSIIQYGRDVIPQGWQLCDGTPLTYKDKSSTARDRFVKDNDGKDINTPSLYNIQLFMPASTQVFFSWSHDFGTGQDSTFDHAWNKSSLYSHYAFHASPNNAYMRINLTSVYEIVGIVIGGGGFRGNPHYVRTFESYVSNVHDPNLLKTYLGSAYSTPNMPIEYCKVTNSQIISKPTWNRTEDIIMFDKGIKGNYFTIKPLTDEHGRFMLRIALLVKPSTKSIIKQPLSTDSI